MTITLLQRLTVEEFEQVADSLQNAERLLELIHGEIVEKMPTEEHTVIAATIARLLGNHVAAYKLGRVAVEPRHRAIGDDHNARLPDVAFTSSARALPLTTKGTVPQLPDLAVEIQSPNDKPHDLREKAHYYLRNGASLVWLVYPANRVIEVCSLNDEGGMQIVEVGVTDTLDGGAVLPDLRLSVQEIFDVE